jgi:hypothetical protein
VHRKISWYQGAWIGAPQCKLNLRCTSSDEAWHSAFVCVKCSSIVIINCDSLRSTSLGSWHRGSWWSCFPVRSINWWDLSTGLASMVSTIAVREICCYRSYIFNASFRFWAVFRVLFAAWKLLLNNLIPPFWECREVQKEIVVDSHCWAWNSSWTASIVSAPQIAAVSFDELTWQSRSCTVVRQDWKVFI